jgi:tripartite-type tricarboxylate transporter receptor subunit TctC
MPNRPDHRRRQCLLALGALPFISPATAFSQSEWPTKNITLIVPVSAGGVVDLVPRVLLPFVSKELGQSIVVDNKPGADLAIGAMAAARSAPDGYTLLAGSIPLTTNPVLKKVQYDPMADFEPVSLIGTTSVMAVVPPSLGVKTLAELVALAKSKPGALNYANSATAGLVHLTTELFNEAAGIKMTEVLYKGQAPALTDLMANRVNFMMVSPSTVLGHVNSGALRALAVIGKTRNPLLPDVPTFAELGFPSVNLDSWIGILAPAKTPAPVIARANAAFNKALANPEVIAQLAKMGVVAAPPNQPAVLRKRMQDELAQWPKVFELAGIKREK